MSKTRPNAGQGAKNGQRSPGDPQRDMYILDRERVHFAFGANDLQSTIGKLRPIIREYAKSGVRKPKDVAHELNAAGMRTACGDKWSPRLTWLLLALVFEKGDPAKGFWQRSRVSKLRRPGGKKAQRTLAPPGIASLDALPNPLRGDIPKPRYYRKGKVVGASITIEPAKLVRAEDRPEFALRLIPKLPSMKPHDIARLFINSVSNLADPAKAELHDATHQLLDAISEEWRRREKLGNPDDYFQWPSTEADRGNGGFSGENWPAEGLLKFMGYTVGATQGERVAVRELILERVFSGHLPRLGRRRTCWSGDPKMAPRLRKMAETIAALTRRRQASQQCFLRAGHTRLGA